MIVGQLQFLTTLSTVDDIAEDDSFLSEFVNNLRYPCLCCIDASAFLLATAGDECPTYQYALHSTLSAGLTIWLEGQQTPGGCVNAHAVKPLFSRTAYTLAGYPT